MILSIDELSRKEVINVETAERVGFVADLDLNTETGQITALLVRAPGGFFKSPPAVKVPYADIVKIGTQTVLVKRVCPVPPSGRGKLAALLGK